MILLDAKRIRNDFPRVVAKAHASLMTKSGEFGESLGPLINQLVDLTLITRSTCLELLDREYIFVTVLPHIDDGTPSWSWHIDEARGEGFSLREQAEMAGIYKGFELLEKKLI